MLEMEAVPLEIILVDKKSGIVVDPPNELMSTPFTLETKNVAVDNELVKMLEMDAVALEIDVVERKGRVVDPPNELISTPLTLETKSKAVDKLLVYRESDLVMPELLIDVAFTVAAVVVPVTDKEPTPAAPVTVKLPTRALLGA